MKIKLELVREELVDDNIRSVRAKGRELGAGPSLAEKVEALDAYIREVVSKRDLMACERCGGQLSTRAPTCPFCGRENERYAVRAEVELGSDEDRVALETIEALAREPNLFVRAGKLVKIIAGASRTRGVERPADAPCIVNLTGANLREICARHIEYVSEDGDPRRAPEAIVRIVLERGEWPGLRTLYALTDVPPLREDGSVHLSPGYDDRTQTYYAPPASLSGLEVKCASRKDARIALAELADPLCDFCFEDEAHKSAAIAAVLSIIGRSAVEGPAPLFAIDKNAPGAGGSLLADAIGTIATGQRMARSTQAESNAETRKLITATALAGDRAVLIDNCEATVGGEALNAALTATSWRDRLLGKMRNVVAPLTTVWLCTGNNLSFNGDTVRRVLHVRLTSPLERPEEREGFKYGDGDELLRYIRDNRARYVSAALGVLSAYLRSGERPALKPWGSYDAWSRVVRGAIVWAGMADPASTRDALREVADTHREQLHTVMTLWAELWPTGQTVARAIEEMRRPVDGEWKSATDREAALAELRVAVADMLGGKPDVAPSARVLAAAFRRARWRNIAGRYLDQGGGNDRTGTKWLVVQATPGGETQETQETQETHSPSSLEKKEEGRRNMGSEQKESPQSPESPRNVVSIGRKRRERGAAS